MKLNELKNQINSGKFDERFAELYDASAVLMQRERYLLALDSFAELFGGEREVNIYSVPGRSELAGNHTDHNCGKVIAASIMQRSPFWNRWMPDHALREGL